MTVQQTVGVGNHPVVTIKLASTSDELMQCYMLRAAVFMGEQACPYWRGVRRQRLHRHRTSSCTSTASRPASMRLRWFQSFCKFERCVVLRPLPRPRHPPRDQSPGARSSPRRKGYTKAYLHAPAPAHADDGEGRLPSRRRQGLQLLRPRVRRVLLRARAGRRTPSELDTEPMVMNRPEDRLDTLGILEKSAERGASNPHAPRAERRAN